MQSAFGIDHGEVSKGRFTWPRIKRPPTMAQRRTQGTPGDPSGPQQAKGALHRMGEADVSLKGIGATAAKGAKGVSGFLERHPGTTGTALVGGAGAGGYRYLSRKEPKKKR